MWHQLKRQKSAAQIKAESDAEMRRFDMLGPLSREAVRNVHRILDIGAVISKFKTERDPSEWDNNLDCYPPLDMQDPKTDARFAARIERVVRDDCGRSIAQCTLIDRRNRLRR